MKRLLPLALLALTWTACQTDEPEVCTVPNEGEVITTVTLTFTPESGAAVEWTFDDPDGDGGEDGTITTAPLAANTSYTVVATLLDASQDPAEPIHEEVEEEAEEHQMFYMASGANITFAYNDTDANGNPLGLEMTATTGDASSGDVTVILRHEPDKDAEGVADGDVTNAGGETDVEVTFDADVE